MAVVHRAAGNGSIPDRSLIDRSLSDPPQTPSARALTVSSRSLTLDLAYALLHARAVLSIVRAGDDFGSDQGVRLQECIAARSPWLPCIEDLLLSEPLQPSELAAQIRAAGVPFRGTAVSASDVAAMIVVDSLRVVLAKGYVSEAEARELIRIAAAVGYSVDEVRQVAAESARYLSVLDSL